MQCGNAIPFSTRRHFYLLEVLRVWKGKAMNEFMDLLDRYLALRELVEVSHGPLWDELQDVRMSINELVENLEKKGDSNGTR